MSFINLNSVIINRQRFKTGVKPTSQTKSLIIGQIKDNSLLYQLDTQSSINSLAFSPTRYWLAAATDAGIKVWDLDSKSLINEFTPEVFAKDGQTKIRPPAALSVAWSSNGDILYGGFTDGVIRAYAVTQN